MTTADLKTGDIVQHPEKGRGYVLRHGEGGSVRVIYASQARTLGFDLDLDTDGWERAEIVKPGHVQVRVDDLDPQTLSEWSQWADHNIVETVLLRVGCAFVARQVGQGDPPIQRTESAPTADEQDANVEAFPHTVMVELRCPHGCGAPVRAKLSTDGYSFPEGGAWPRLVAVPQHTCQPTQPDEPTEFGARVTVTRESGTREKWCRLGRDKDAPWLDENCECGGDSWQSLCRLGTVSLGWGDES